MKNHNKPAYPNQSNLGLTKRELIATQIIAGVVSNMQPRAVLFEIDWAIKVADLLLKRLEETPLTS